VISRGTEIGCGCVIASESKEKIGSMGIMGNMGVMRVDGSL